MARRPFGGGFEEGLTLIEISVALAVVALALLVAVPSIEAFTGVVARQEAGRLAGAIRFLYGASALSGKVCRLVFDMDEKAWWAECTEGRFTVEREKEKALGGRRVEKETEKKPDQPRDEIEAMRLKVEKKAEFSEFTGEEVKRHALPDGAELSVWTGHQREKYTKGIAYLYFFPQGNTERARIYLSSGHGHTYTLVVFPLNGRVQVVDEELEVPRD
jgi:general secretion pathway protein H